MTQTEAALAGAGIGAFTAILAAGLAGFVQLRLERLRQVEARQMATINELRSSVAEAFRNIFVIQHHTQNLCWFANHSPDTIDTQITLYYEAVDKAWPTLWGSIAVVAGTDIETYGRLRPLVDVLADFESEVTKACEDYRRGNGTAIERLKKYDSRARDLYQSLPSQLATVMSSILPKISGGRTV